MVLRVMRQHHAFENVFGGQVLLVPVQANLIGFEQDASDAAFRPGRRHVCSADKQGSRSNCSPAVCLQGGPGRCWLWD